MALAPVARVHDRRANAIRPYAFHDPRPYNSHMSRHLRQETFPRIGRDGQAKLRAARVAIVGLGALGTHLAELLGRAGVGALTLIDRDVIELSNLQRQTLFTTADLGRPKAVTVAAHLHEIDPGLKLEAKPEEFAADNALELAQDHDLLLDGTDNFETRFLINEVAHQLSIPWVMAAVVGSYGQIQPVIPGKSACLMCLLEEIPSTPGPTCETAGVIGPAVAAVTAFAAAEALKLLIGDRESLSGPAFFDLWDNQFQRLEPAPPRADCRACAGERPILNGERPPMMIMKYCGSRTVQIRPPEPLKVDLATLAAGLPTHYKPVQRDGVLALASGESELLIFPDGRALVRNVDSPEAARRIYAQVLGV